jgi:hypothetical protein
MKKHISMILIVVMAISYLAIVGQTAVAGTTTPTSCDDFSYWTQRLCTKYCEKLECDEEIPHYQITRRWLCKYYEYRFTKKTGIEPPCDGDPCAELAAIAECPCTDEYFQIPMTTECWTPNIDTDRFSPCNAPGCAVPLDECNLTSTPVTSLTEIGAINSTNTTAGLTCHAYRVGLDTTCGTPGVFVTDTISGDQFATCLCRVAQYANQAAAAGVPIADTVEPFSCEPPE